MFQRILSVQSERFAKQAVTSKKERDRHYHGELWMLINYCRRQKHALEKHSWLYATRV